MVAATGASITRTRHREVWFGSTHDTAALAGLRTVDDVFAVAAVVDGIDHRRDAIGRLAAAVSEVPIPPPPDHAAAVEVVASFVGKRNYNRFDIEDALGAVIGGATGLAHASRRDGARPPAGSWVWRVTIEGEEAMVGIRLGDRPVGDRQRGVVASRAGVLPSPLAAAMCRLADVDALPDGAVLLDPFAGSGTIVEERDGWHRRASRSWAPTSTRMRSPWSWLTPPTFQWPPRRSTAS